MTEYNFPIFARPNEPIKQFLLGAKEDGATVHYVTSRPKFLTKHTQRWLKKHGFPDHDNVFAGVPTPDGKIEYLKHLCKKDPGSCIFIENNEKARQIANEKLKVKTIDPNGYPNQ